MKNIVRQLDSKIVSDLIILLVLGVGAVVYLQYSTEIRNQMADMMRHPVQEFKNSIAELDSPVR